MDLKYDDNFDRVASVGGSSVHVWQLDEGDTSALTNVDVFTQSSLGVLKPMALSTSRSEYEITGVHFVDDGASVIVCTMEDHKV